MKRRSFNAKLGTALASSIMLGKLPVWAMDTSDFINPDENILVIVQLFGGNDGLNTVIPGDNDLYYNKYRPQLAIARNELLRLGNSNSYFNPALKSGKGNGMMGLFSEGNLGIIQGIGYPNPNLSHFRSTDIWLSGINPASDTERLETGWAGRYFNETVGNTSPDFPICLNIGTSSSLLFQAGQKDMSVAVENPLDFYERGKDILSGDSPTAGNSKYAGERNFLLDLSIQSNKYSKVVKDAFDKGKNSLEYAKDKLSEELKLVGRLISGGLKTKIYLVSIDGFDTHASQGASSGKHAALLTNISDAVSHFMADLKAQNLGKNVVGMTVSEFGRRPHENDSLGTDHGASSVMFMFGEPVNNKLFGKAFDFNKLNANKDFEHQYDFRSVYDEVLSKWFGASDKSVKEILGKRYTHIEDGLLTSKSKVVLANEVSPKSNFYPNPTSDGWITLKIVSDGISPISIMQSNMVGRRIQIMPALILPAGIQKVPLQIKGGTGTYILEIHQGNKIITHKILRF